MKTHISHIMKKTIATILFASLTISAAAQCADSTCVKCPEHEKTCACNKDSKCNKSSTDENKNIPAQYPGGVKALTEYLGNNIKYPELADKYGVEGRIVMHFIVEKDGSLSNITASDCQIDRFITTKFAQEPEAKQKKLREQFALLFAKEGARVIKSMKKWTPGTINGVPASTKYTLPITFNIPYK